MSGLNRFPAKKVQVNSLSRVQIPYHPLNMRSVAQSVRAAMVRYANVPTDVLWHWFKSSHFSDAHPLVSGKR